MELDGRVTALEARVAALEKPLTSGLTSGVSNVTEGLKSGVSNVTEGLKSGFNNFRSTVGIGGRRKSRKSRKTRTRRR